MYGIEFKGINSSALGLAIRTLSLPLKAEQRYSEAQVIGKDSSYKWFDGFNDKEIELEITLIEPNYITKRQKAREIASWLNGQGRLYFDYEPDKYYNAYVLDVIDSEIDTVTDVYKVKFIVEPFAYVDKSLNYGQITGAKSISILNDGTHIAKPIIKLVGTATNITFASDNGSFSLSGLSQTTYVDCERMVCYSVDGLGIKTNKLGQFTGQFLDLAVGSNQIDITGANLALTLTINYQEKWI